MTTEELKIKRTKELLNFFIDNGIESTRLLSVEAIAKFNVTPIEFYGIMLCVLESFMKNFTNNNSALKFKKIFNDKKRQKLVDFFYEAISTNSTE
jgi:hypothetical protein